MLKISSPQIEKVPRCCRMVRLRHLANDKQSIWTPKSPSNAFYKEILVSSQQKITNNKISSNYVETFLKLQRFWHCYHPKANETYLKKIADNKRPWTAGCYAIFHIYQLNVCQMIFHYNYMKASNNKASLCYLK